MMPTTPHIPKPVARHARRLLHIEPDDVAALELKLALKHALPPDMKIVHVSDYMEGLDQIGHQEFDLVLLALALDSERSLDLLADVVAASGNSPVLVLSDENSAATAVAAGRAGAAGLLAKKQLKGNTLLEAIDDALRQNGGSVANDDRHLTCNEIKAPAVIYPIRTDRSPGAPIPAFAVSISLAGIVLLVEEDSSAIPTVCLVGVEDSQYHTRFAAVEWLQRKLALPCLKLEGRFLTGQDDPLHRSQLVPQFDPQLRAFAAPLAADVLQAWVDRGVLHAKTIDRVKVCPACSALPSFRDGCPKCGSSQVTRVLKIHHFACAHSAPVEAFGDEPLSCPKCHARNLVAGADYNFLSGPCLCQECGWNDTATALVAECLGCGNRFAGADAPETDICQYHVERLDPLAFLAESD